MIEYTDCVKYNLHFQTYGSARRIRKNYLRAALALLCLITPGTNWLLPLIHKIIRTDVVIRF